jgi:hypothetical protein
MAADSMPLRDMLFWLFLTLFGTGTYVIYGPQSIVGQVCGIAMITVGFIGMLACAWSQLKDPGTGKVQLTIGRLRRSKKAKAIATVVMLVLLVGIGTAVFR